MQQQDAKLMGLAIVEARKGSGRTSPNPAVGAVVVKEGIIMGKGYHKKAGTPHAEVNAIADAGSDVHGATLYVTLEPCNHTGRTPPCTRAILQAGISRVVIGMLDPHATASGGAEFLRSHNLSVQSGILEQQCRRLNYPFIKHVTTGLPWVIMKAGMSLDGRITYRPQEGGSITGNDSKQYVHGMRDRVDAILIGIDTAFIDNPSLTTRLEGGLGGRDPLRVVLDTRLRLSPESLLLSQQSTAATWVFYGTEVPEEQGAALKRAGAVLHRVDTGPDNRLDLVQVLEKLGKADITTVLVEGGAGVHGAFLQQGLADEAYLFYAPFFIGDTGTPLVRGYQVGPPGERPVLQDVSVQHLGGDVLVHGFFKVP